MSKIKGFIIFLVLILIIGWVGIENLFYCLDSSRITAIEQRVSVLIGDGKLDLKDNSANLENDDQESENNLDDIDDQRSTLWPLLVSLMITMVGSLITTFIFLKDALDRTLDEKPYYQLAIQRYREKTMRSLYLYTLISLGLIVIVVGLYGLLYFLYIRSVVIFRSIIYMVYVFLLIWCGNILYRCIYVDDGIRQTIDELLKEKSQQVEQLSDVLSRGELLALRNEMGLKNDNDVVRWLQIEPNKEIGETFENKFISRFSAWESLLMLLVSRENSAYNVQTTNTQIRTALEKSDDIFEIDESDFEWEDAHRNQWFGETCDKILQLKRRLATNYDQFMTVFKLLVDYRNLLQVKIDTEGYAINHIQKGKCFDVERDTNLVDLFLYFCLFQAVYIFRLFPKIDIFFPVGFFEVANFYGVRFENTSFRASKFKNVIFSRAKIDNSNFSISSFEKCEFYNTDSRNCSLSNALFEKCNFQKANFVDVDFTGTVLKECKLKNASFHNVVLENICLTDSEFEHNDIINSKIENVVLEYKQSLPSFRCCNFSESSLLAIQLHIAELPIARPFTNNPIVNQVFNFISKHNTFLCGIMQSTDEKNRFSEIKRIIASFCVENGLFLRSKPGYRREGRAIIQEEPLWKYIKRLGIISMEECIFNNAFMPRIMLCRIIMEQSVLKNVQMDAACLICVYMSGSILPGANLRESILWASILSNSVLDDGILFKSTCSMVNFEDSSLHNLHASESVIENCSFGQSDCTGIDLTRAKVSLSCFRDTILSAAELTGAEFKGVEFDNSVAERMLSSYTLFENCDFVNVSLKQSNFNYTTFKKCDFLLADFSNSIVTNVKFECCDFKESNFRGTHFIRPIFKDCENMKIDYFSGCNFIYPQFLGSSREFEVQIQETDCGIVLVNKE